MVVTGEYKQGKSALVNGLVGRAVCPVDGDAATSVLTVCRAADDLSVTIQGRAASGARRVRADPSLVPDVVTERGNPRNELGIAWVEVGVPSPLLAAGFTLVDTPGIGGFADAGTAAVVGALGPADAVLVVSDATSELAATELAVLHEAVGNCPVVVVVVTKIDLVPDWRVVVDRNLALLERAGLDVAVVAVSSELQAAALAGSDRQLGEEGGFPVLIEGLEREVLAEAAARAEAAVSAEIADALAQVELVFSAEESALEADAEAAALVVQSAGERLARVRAASSKWLQVLNDRMTDAGHEVGWQLKQDHRRLLRAIDEGLDAARGPEQWADTAAAVERDVRSVVVQAFEALEHGVGEAVAQVEALVDASLGTTVAGLGRPGSIPLAAPEVERPAPQGSRRLASSVGSAVGTLRGVQGGVVLLSTLVTLVPGAAAAAVSAPVVLSIAAAFGGKAMIDQRRRKEAEGRQKVRLALRGFVDEAMLRVGNDLSAIQREAFRVLREDIGQRMAELVQTVTEAHEAARSARDAGSHTRAERLATVRRDRAAVAALQAGGGAP